VYRADTLHGAQINDYRVAVSNKLYHPAFARVSVEGLPPEAYTLSAAQANFTSAGRIDLNLHVADGLPPGLHSLLVRVRADNGWEDTFRVQHFVGRG
jgi:hypothetical protein